MLVFFVAPIAIFIAYSFLTAQLYDVSRPFTLDAYRAALDSQLNRTLARNSIEIGLLAAVCSVALALPVAYWLRYTTGRWRMVVLFLITASMFASYLVRIYAWRTMLGEHGVVNSALQSLGLIDHPLGFLIFNRFAVTVALVLFLPYAVLVLFASSSRSGPDCWRLHGTSVPARICAGAASSCRSSRLRAERVPVRVRALGSDTSRRSSSAARAA
jgi:spermidine/putrescine transport system permease protein